MEEGLFTGDELNQIEREAQEEADKAAEFALNSPDPDPASLLDDVFYEGGDAQ